MKNYIETIRHAFNRSVPIVVIRTPDPDYTITAIHDALDIAPMLRWRITTGVTPVDDSAIEAASLINADDSGADFKVVTGNHVEALERVLKFMPSKHIVFFCNLNFALEQQDDMQRLVAIQSVWDCRDPLKGDNRMLVLVSNDIDLPAELAGEVLTIDIPYPTKEEIGVIVRDIATAGQITVDDDTVNKCADAMLGMSPFAVDQTAALALTKTGFDIPAMWEMKVADINRTPGLRVEIPKSSFDNLIGLDSISGFGKALLVGEEPPAVVVLLDEIDRQMAGTGDSSGVSQDQVGQVLTCMEEYQWDGMLLYGFGGSGKTEFSKCLGAKAGLFTWMDLGGMKTKFVGDSERQVRAAMKKLYAIGGNRVFIVGTCNGLASIPAPLYRRLSAGTYFFDFPEKKAQAAMWNYYMGVNGLPEQPLPEHENWTGAEVKKCCQWARRLRWTLVQASKRITPVSKAMGDDVRALRAQASGKYLSPSQDGYYVSKQPVSAGNVKRSISSN